MISARNVDFPAEMFPSTQSVTPLVCPCEETADIARLATFGRQNCLARAGCCVVIRYDRKKPRRTEVNIAHGECNSLSMSRQVFYQGV